MTTYHDIFPDPIELLFTKVFSEEGTFTYVVPNDNSIKFFVVTAEGCGGMGDSNGGGGAQVKRKAAVTPGETLTIQVGKTSTASVLGDSFVKRANNTFIVYADRGRGNGNPGSIINSTGDVKRDGRSGGGSSSDPTVGAPASDAADTKSVGMGGFGFNYAQPNLSQGADYGGGGRLYPRYDSGGEWDGTYTSDGAGSGFIKFEAYNGDPGSIT
jgi:hypothetical protein